MSERSFYLPIVDPDDPHRLAVYFDRGDHAPLVDIAEEELTSAGPNAQQVETPNDAVRRLCLTKVQAAWLRDVLIKLDLGEASAPAEER